ncbi:phage tail tube protein [Nesterenkonia haasae]|uniref:phage tail tube protein n=1 Tax=Nesterenkonia haasae TaxID=2587813 RepID=UPI001390AC0C|nr:hypothetical protein [Nesterenkonia haasae]NDK31180.1 hypothetical protein [Nesterenkonia haasae]
MGRRLSQGRIKLTLLVDAPADPENPTASELNDGHDASADIDMPSFVFTAADSDTRPNTKLVSRSQSQMVTNRNHEASIRVERGYTAGGDTASDDETAQLILDNVGSRIWAYKRESDKWSTDEWEDGDMYAMGGSFEIDTPKRGDQEGNIAFDVRLLPQDVYDFGTVAAGSGT